MMQNIAKQGAKRTRQLTRVFSTSAQTQTPSPTQSSNIAPATTVYQYGLKSQSGALTSQSQVNVSTLTRPGGRQSVSGIVATVFGGTGFVGRYAVNNLGRIGSQVIVPYRGDGLNTRHLRLSGDLGQIVPIPYDLADEESIRRTVARSNVVVNLIGAHYETANYSYDDVHVKIAYRLAKIAKESGVERFIHVSAFGADKNSPSAWLRSKAKGEEVVRSFFPDATILRPATIFGRADNFLNYYAFVGKRFTGVPVTREGQQKLSPVFVQDVSRAILGAITFNETLGQTYELTGPEVFTVEQLVGMVQKSTNTPFMKISNMSEQGAIIYGKIVGGRRGTSMYSSDPTQQSLFADIFDKVTSPFQTLFSPLQPLAGPVRKALSTLAGKFTFPSIFHPDMVQQQKVDQVASSSSLGLHHLGVTPTSMRQEIDDILYPHQWETIDRFQDAARMKHEAGGADKRA